MRVITLNDDEALINYAKPIVAELRANMARVDSDFSATPFKAKIADAEQRRVHTMLVIGGHDMEAGNVSCVCTTEARKAPSPRWKSLRIFWPASKREGRKRTERGALLRVFLL